MWFISEKESLDIWVNGLKAETTHEFADEGTEMHFFLDKKQNACIKTISSGNKKEGIVYSLIVNGIEIPESFMWINFIVIEYKMSKIYNYYI